MKLGASPELIAERLLGRPFDELDEDEQRILARVVSDEIELEPEESEVANVTAGDRLADRVAAVGGSWPFIGLFVFVVLGWMLLNSDWAGRLEQTWDQYPYVFLNFVLSLTAALQAPIIMMSQNRQAAKDRISNRHDYEINLRTTVEILELGSKVDKILNKLGQMEQRLDEGSARDSESV
jgi:uncharacterized membrane protein